MEREQLKKVEDEFFVLEFKYSSHSNENYPKILNWMHLFIHQSWKLSSSPVTSSPHEIWNTKTWRNGKIFQIQFSIFQLQPESFRFPLSFPFLPLSYSVGTLKFKYLFSSHGFAANSDDDVKPANLFRLFHVWESDRKV